MKNEDRFVKEFEIHWEAQILCMFHLLLGISPFNV